jgi:hypothetical protein
MEASDEAKYIAILALAEGKLSEADFTAWLRERMRAATSAAIHEVSAQRDEEKRPARPPRERATARAAARR